MRVAPSDERQAEIAVEAYTRYGKGRHPAGLNFGDGRPGRHGLHAGGNRFQVALGRLVADLLADRFG